MATRKKYQPPEESGNDNLMQRAAKALGSALGTLAVKTGISQPPSAPPKEVAGSKTSEPKKSSAAPKTISRKTRPASRKKQSSGKHPNANKVSKAKMPTRSQ